MQEVLQLQPELEGFKEQGLDFYFVIAGRERELRAFFERYPVAANVVWDQELEIFWDYDVEGLPVSFFVDKNGVVRETKLGWDKDSPAEFKELVDQLVAE